MDFSLLTYDLEGTFALIGLNRPSKRNSINDVLIGELRLAVERAGREAQVGIIYGHGEHFSAGLDLAEHLERTPMQGLANSQLWHGAFNAIERGAIPFIAAMRGAVIGGGLELAASVHIRIADRTAFFALPEGQRGIFVGGGGSVRVARLISAARMTDMMLTGRTLSAEVAERVNLIHYLCDGDLVLDEARKIAAKIASNSRLSNYAITNALSRIQDLSHDDGLFFESLMAAFTQTSDEAVSRLKAFLEKRAGRVRPPE